MKTMKIEVLKEVGLLEMILVTSRLRYNNLMTTSNQKNNIDWVQALEKIIEFKEYNDE